MLRKGETEHGCIKEVSEGYLVTVYLGKGMGRDVFFLVTEQGEMIGDGSPVIESDWRLARMLLKQIGKSELGDNLYAGGPNPELILRAKKQLSQR